MHILNFLLNRVKDFLVKIYATGVTIQKIELGKTFLPQSQSWQLNLQSLEDAYTSQKYTLEKYTLEVWKLFVIACRKYIMSRGLRTLRNGPETVTQWKSESVSDRPTNLLTEG